MIPIERDSQQIVETLMRLEEDMEELKVIMWCFLLLYIVEVGTTKRKKIDYEWRVHNDQRNNVCRRRKKNIGYLVIVYLVRTL